MITLQAFKDSATYCDNFSAHYQDGWFDESTSNQGFLYLGGQHWIAKEANGHWWAQLGNVELDSTNLSEIENELYRLEIHIREGAAQ